jgi:serine/threonine-protein kinase
MSSSPPLPPTDRDLLFGVLAVRTALLPRDDLLAALKARDPSAAPGLGQFAVERHLLREDECQLLEDLAQRLIDRHGGDTRNCLSAVGSADLLGHLLPTVQEPAPGPLSVDSGDTSDPHTVPPETDSRTIPPPPVPRPSGSRQRYRTLRPHAKGGLGTVYVAIDEELHREVALKEIQERHAHHPENRRRFLLEAEVTGALEHPGIVPVYGLGAYPDGRPFYAMRFIRGHSLDQAIKQFHAEHGPAREPAARTLALRELLGRFVAVCNAVAYAHSRGVLHRDLKPSNVMLGPYGETLVVDWGLAKVAGQADAAVGGDDTLVQLPSAQTPAPTAGGRVLGTPQYMSPEQASGRLDEMGPASDVYSLGATLFQLLTGKAPFPAENTQQVLERVRSGDLVPPRQVNPSVPAALDAVCRKAMALRPQDRYGSAQELAQEVERWLADQPVTAYREPLPARLGRWARRHRALTAAAAALLLTAAVGLGVGLWAVGREQLRTAQQRDRAEENLRLVELERQHTAEQRDLAEANLRQARKAVDECFLLAKDHPLLQREQLAAVRRLLLERALPFYKDFQVQRPDAPGVREELAANYHHVGLITRQIGRQADAVTALRQAQQAWSRLAEEQPGQVRYQTELARTDNDLGLVLASTGQSDAALAAYREALAIWGRLVGGHPGEESYQVDRAKTYSNQGGLFNSTAKRGEAVAAYDEAQKVCDRLVQRHPNNPDYLSLQATVSSDRAKVLHAGGKVREAEEAFLKARQVQERLTREHPDVPLYRTSLARTCLNLGTLYLRANKPDEALRYYSESKAIGEKLVVQPTEVTRFWEDLAKSSKNVAVVHAIKGQYDAALPIFRSVEEVQERLVHDHPEVPEYQADLAMTRTNIGSVLQLTRKNDLALAAYRQADAVWTKLIAKYPDVLAYKINAAGCQGNIGNLLRGIGKHAESLKWLDGALKLLEEVRAREPNNPAVGQFLCNTHQVRAEALSRLGRIDEALRAWDQALAMAPENRKVVLRAGRTATLARSGQHARAEAEAVEVARAPGLTDEALYFLACAYAQAAAAAGKDPQLSPAQRDRLAERYAAAAVETLKKAKSAGWFNDPAHLPSMKEDDDLAPLRERSDYRKFVDTLEKASPSR